VLVGQIADDAPQGRRELLDERGRCEDFVVLSHLRLLEDIDDLQLVFSLEVVVTDSAKVRNGDLGLGSLAGDVELEDVLRQRDASCNTLVLGCRRSFGCHRSESSRRSQPWPGP
jgi:hypothetical protein